MTPRRISVRLDKSILERLRKLALATGTDQSEIIRQALAEYLRHRAPIRTCYDVAKDAGVIGCVKGGPRDLCTNPKRRKRIGRE